MTNFKKAVSCKCQYTINIQPNLEFLYAEHVTPVFVNKIPSLKRLFLQNIYMNDTNCLQFVRKLNFLYFDRCLLNDLDGFLYLNKLEKLYMLDCNIQLYDLNILDELDTIVKDGLIRCASVKDRNWKNLIWKKYMTALDMLFG